jgi:hypothetical protein
VRFVYEKEEQGAGSRGQGAERNLLILEALATLPEAWRADLKQAILDVDLDYISILIDQIRDRNIVLADTLKESIQNFEYRKILQVIQAIPQQTLS